MGYTGSTGALMATIKGETDLWSGLYIVVQSAIKDGDVKPLMQMGGKRIPGLNIPILEEVVAPKWKRFMKLLNAQYSVSRLVAATPGLPEARTKFLREAFRRMAHDEKFLSMAKKMNLPIQFTPGDELHQWINDAMDQSPEVIDLLKSVLL